jgi:epoxyqueuosine reductase
MEYLIRGRDRRADPRLLFPEAQSILCVAIPYARQPAGEIHSAGGPRYARYLQGPDYHEELSLRLERAMLQAQSKHPELKWKICVDTSAVLERTWAALAGLGWIGKNTLLIHPKHGSYLFLAEVLVNQKTGKGPAPLPNYCGNCNRCLTSCPTQALKTPGILDSNDCISYNTLEKKKEIPLLDSQKAKFKNWIAGCDICQEVCPFNIKPTQKDTSPIPTPNATQLQTWKQLILETPDQYKIRIKDSALKRIKPPQFSRNLALTLNNSASEIINQNKKENILDLISLIDARTKTETDLIAQNEWQKCFANFLHEFHKAQLAPHPHSEIEA